MNLDMLFNKIAGNWEKDSGKFVWLPLYNEHQGPRNDTNAFVRMAIQKKFADLSALYPDRASIITQDDGDTFLRIDFSKYDAEFWNKYQAALRMIRKGYREYRDEITGASDEGASVDESQWGDFLARQDVNAVLDVIVTDLPISKNPLMTLLNLSENLPGGEDALEESPGERFSLFPSEYFESDPSAAMSFYEGQLLADNMNSLITDGGALDVAINHCRFIFEQLMRYDHKRTIEIGPDDGDLTFELCAIHYWLGNNAEQYLTSCFEDLPQLPLEEQIDVLASRGSAADNRAFDLFMASLGQRPA